MVSSVVERLTGVRKVIGSSPVFFFRVACVTDRIRSFSGDHGVREKGASNHGFFLVVSQTYPVGGGQGVGTRE